MTHYIYTKYMISLALQSANTGVAIFLLPAIIQWAAAQIGSIPRTLIGLQFNRDHSTFKKILMQNKNIAGRKIYIDYIAM